MKFSAIAIVVGVVTDLVLTVLGSLILFLVGIGSTSPALYAWSLVLGLVAVAGGGYVAARSSQKSKIFNTLIYGIVEVFIGLAFAVFSTEVPLWFDIVGSILTIPAALVGAYCAGGGHIR
jgi:hypothetical protein